MLTKLILATRNLGKTKEIHEFLKELPVQVQSVLDYPNCPDSKEPYSTYEENARDKARIVAKHCGAWALADDSGLEIEVLSGRPGVLSARYAGKNATYEENCRKVLEDMKEFPQAKRQAQFRCSMVLSYPDGQEFVSEGILQGFIALRAQGEHGFGYDPIFFVPQLRKTLAELSLLEKNQLSHRRRALEAMLPHLTQLLTK